MTQLSIATRVEHAIKTYIEECNAADADSYRGVSSRAPNISFRPRRSYRWAPTRCHFRVDAVGPAASNTSRR